MKTILYILPLNIISNLIGKLACISRPRFLSKIATRIFANFYKLNMEEASLPLSEYNSVAEVFTRQLKPGARTAQSDFVSPVDGTLRAKGPTLNTTILVKGVGFSLEKLIGSSKYAARLEKGSFFNFYLAPYNYHRIHTPCDGKLISTYHIPGKLFPVNDYGFNLYPDLFNLNERVVSYFETKYGLVAVVAVGALNVGKITVPHIKLSSNCYTRTNKEFDYQADFKILDELAIFELGSSVVVLTEQDLGIEELKILKLPFKLGESLLN